MHQARQTESKTCLTGARAGGKSRKRSRLESVPWLVPLEGADTVRNVSEEQWGQAPGEVSK